MIDVRIDNHRPSGKALQLDSRPTPLIADTARLCAAGELAVRLPGDLSGDLERARLETVEGPLTAAK